MDVSIQTKKVYCNPSHLAPYLATELARKKGVDVAELQENAAAEADAAAGSVLRRVSSFSILARSPPAHQSSNILSQVASSSNNRSNGNREEQEERQTDQIPESLLPIYLQAVAPSWRLRDRMKTVAVGLVMALNVGTDPPDITKPHPCAKLQCWIDPFSVTPRSKAIEKIGKRLETQYGRWQHQQRAIRQLKFRQALDPTVEDVRGLCLWLRRQARQERILFHYNGHGVPRPTINGEVWVFDKNHTQYIPLCVPDLRQWLGKPSIVVLDCSSAGVLIPFFTSPLPEESPGNPSSASDVDTDTATSQLVRDTIVLCPTSENEWLPMHPDYPADTFTSCLTTPIQMALRWFIRRNPQSMGGLSPDVVDAIPGMANDRKTPLGELNWIFTAVTDSIAWNVLPKALFQRLFRQDLLVASIFHCTPQSYPALPPGLADHPLWQAWDLACETRLFGLIKDGVLGNHVITKPPEVNTESSASEEIRSPSQPDAAQQSSALAGPSSSISSPFFSEQLTAFEIWLDFATIQQNLCQKSRRQLFELDDTPEQLPVVLQVLLSQVNRVRALSLLRRFLELGPWAVNLSLTLGIFPYVMKLLQSPEYKSLLVAIWTSVLSFDASCQVDLVKDGALPHFIHHLSFGLKEPVESGSQEESAEQRTMAAFILAATCHNYPQGQIECIRQNLLGTCLSIFASMEKLKTATGEALSSTKTDRSLQEGLDLQFPPRFRLWLCLCLGNLVRENEAVQAEVIATGIHQCLKVQLEDASPEVRASACYALGCLVGRSLALPTQRVGMVGQSSPQIMSLNRSPLTTSMEGGNPASQVAAPETGMIGQRPVDLTMDYRGTGSSSLHGLQPSFGNPGPPHTQWYPQYAQSSLMHPGSQMAPNLQRPRVHFQGQPDHMYGQQNVSLLGSPLQAQGLTSTPESMHRTLPLLGVTSTGSRPTLDDGPQLFSPSNHPFFQGGRSDHGSPAQALADRRRFEWDMSVVEWLLKSTEDPSPLVRYEATISSASVVAKYLKVFLAAADVMSSSHGSSSTEDSGESTTQTFDTALQGISKLDVDKVLPAWKTLRSLQHKDAHPCISSVANAVVSVVHEQLLLVKLDSPPGDAASKRLVEVDSNRLSGSRIDNNPLTGIMEESDIPVEQHRSVSTSKILFSQAGESQASVTGIPPQRVTQTQSGDASLRRVSSSYAGLVRLQPVLNPSEQVDSTSRQAGVISGGSRQQTQYTMPKSKLYDWKKETFASDTDRASRVELSDPDPLDPEYASESYRQGRNWRVHRSSMKMVENYASLYPKPPKPKRTSIEMILHEEEEDASFHKAEEEASTKKKELELVENKLFKNTGAKMTSILRFHAYEDVLMACDARDGISLWDCEKGSLASAFSNGNAKGSRITTGMWINEASSSAFLVGCDDGSVHIWGNLLEDNGKPSQKTPLLCSAFYAAPDLIAGGRGSGLICEWQQFNGCLLAGGNSRKITCWDLEAEKFKTELEIPRAENTCVTTLTTAWDFESLGDGSTSGYHGIGPGIVVAGHSDGSIRVFDIRFNQPAAESSRRDRSRRRAPTEYLEHDSWIVETSFTGYGTMHEILSGSVSGDVKAWDLRMSLSVRTLEVQRSTMTALAFHRKLPIFATGSHAQFIKILSLDGDTLQVFRNHQGLGGRRIGPVSCLEFHPHKLVVAAGATDDIISLYVPKK